MRDSSICFTWARQFGEVRRDNSDCSCFVLHFIQYTETRFSLCVWRAGQFRFSSMKSTEDVWLCLLLTQRPPLLRIFSRAVTSLMVSGSQTELALRHLSSNSSIYWTGPFPGVKSPIEACALGGGGRCVLS